MSRSGMLVTTAGLWSTIFGHMRESVYRPDKEDWVKSIYGIATKTDGSVPD